MKQKSGREEREELEGVDYTEMVHYVILNEKAISAISFKKRGPMAKWTFNEECPGQEAMAPGKIQA